MANTKNETPRRTRYLEYIGQFTSDIRYIAGEENRVADALSRVETINCPSPIDYDALAQSQVQDKELDDLKKKGNLDFKNITIPGTTTTITCETSSGSGRPYLPKEFRETAYHAIHDLSHPGIRTTRRMVSSRYFWPSMNSDVNSWARTCIPCQRAKVHKHTKSPLSTFEEVDRFSHVHIDITGPLPVSEGYRYLLTSIDRASKWPEAFPMEEITAEKVANTFYAGWIARFGCPATITTDQGRQFESDLFNTLTRRMGIKRNRTTAYHPQANGLIERWHRSLKTALITRCNSPSWSRELPTVLLGLRAALKEDIGKSVAELLYGQTIRLPGEFYGESSSQNNMSSYFLQNLTQSLKKSQSQRKCNKDKASFIHEELSYCSHVFVRNDAVKKPLTPNYNGPFRVIDRRDKYYKLQLQRRTANVSIDRIKPAFTVNTEATANENIRVTRSGRISKPPVRFAGGE